MEEEEKVVANKKETIVRNIVPSGRPELEAGLHDLLVQSCPRPSGSVLLNGGYETKLLHR